MDWLASLLNGIWQAFVEWFKGVIKYASDAVSWFWTTVAVGVAGLFHALIVTFASIVHAATDKLTTVVLPNLGLPPLASDVYNFANTFAPVTEALTLGSAYLALVGVLTAYRLIKSWIPTLS